jgi:hypothetical protein
MYTVVCSVDVLGGTIGRLLIDSTPYSVNSTQTYAIFWNTLWVIPGHTRQPLDWCVIIPDVR